MKSIASCVSFDVLTRVADAFYVFSFSIRVALIVYAVVETCVRMSEGW